MTVAQKEDEGRNFGVFFILHEPPVRCGREIALQLFGKYSGNDMIAPPHDLSLLERGRGGEAPGLFGKLPDGQRGRPDLLATRAFEPHATGRQPEAEQAASGIAETSRFLEIHALLEAAGLRPGPTGGGSP